MRLGTTQQGWLIVKNRTRAAIRSAGCGPGFQVVLSNRKYRQESAWPAVACTGSFVIPEGTTRYPVTVFANGDMPPGLYKAKLAQYPVLVPTPTSLALRITRT